MEVLMVKVAFIMLITRTLKVINLKLFQRIVFHIMIKFICFLGHYVEGFKHGIG